ncbi:MAG: hypothetical protein AAF630_14060 [Cyanobacteria bacterium P01_C01_bin.38]
MTVSRKLNRKPINDNYTVTHHERLTIKFTTIHDGALRHPVS